MEIKVELKLFFDVKDTEKGNADLTWLDTIPTVPTATTPEGE